MLLSKKAYYLILLVFISSLHPMEDPSLNNNKLGLNGLEERAKSRVKSAALAYERPSSSDSFQEPESASKNNTSKNEHSPARSVSDKGKENDDESYVGRKKPIDLRDPERAAYDYVITQLQFERIDSMRNKIDSLQREILSLRDNGLQADIDYNRAVKLCTHRANGLNSALINAVIENCPNNLKTIIYFLKNRDQSSNRLVYLAVPPCIVLVGQPGVGKSVLAQSIALHCNINHLLIECTNIHNEFKDSGSSNLNRLFTPLFLKEEPFIIILDEIHTIVKKRNDKYSDEDAAQTLWTALDIFAKKPNVLIIATANTLENLPEQLKSRLSDCIFTIMFPDLEQRKRIIKYYLDLISSEIKLGVDENTAISKIASLTSRMSNRDIEKTIEHAKRLAYYHRFDVKNPTKSITLQLEDIYKARSLVIKNNGSKSWHKKTYDFIQPAIYPTVSIGLPLMINLIYSYITFRISNRMAESHHADGLRQHAQTLPLQQAGLIMQKEALRIQKVALKAQILMYTDRFRSQEMEDEFVNRLNIIED